MKRQLEQREDRQRVQTVSSKDRSDWIAKYLELADTLIHTHMPGPCEQEDA